MSATMLDTTHTHTLIVHYLIEFLKQLCETDPISTCILQNRKPRFREVKTPCPRSHSYQMVGMEVWVASRYICLILELELSITGPSCLPAGWSKSHHLTS